MPTPRTPIENPTPLTNLIQMVAIFAIGAALTNVFGRMVGDQRQGWAILAVMGLLFFAGVTSPTGRKPTAIRPARHSASIAAGGNMEGKEVRFGIAALRALRDGHHRCVVRRRQRHARQLHAAGRAVPLINMQLGEIIFGGVGSGLYGMLLFAILAVFIAGLMVGRTPEYLGKKIEAKEVKMAMLAILISAAADARIHRARGRRCRPDLSSIQNAGPHGFSEVLYAYTSATANNGSAFAGIAATRPSTTSTIGLAMLIGRFLMIVPMLAIAGSLAAKKIVPPSAGTFPTTGALWVGLLIGVILIVGGLTYFPALALGPIAEHLAMGAGKLF